MDKKRNTKYFRWGATLLGVVLASIVFCVILLNLKGFFGIISDLIAILSPVILGVIFAYLLNPMVNAIDRALPKLLLKKMKKESTAKKISRAVGIVVSLSVGLFLVYGLFYLVLPQLYETIMGIVNKLPEYFSTVEKWVLSFFEDNPEMSANARTMLDNAYLKLEDWLSEDGFLLDNLQKIMNGVTTSLMSVIKAVANAVIGIVASVYILWSKETFLGQIKKILVALCRPEKADRILYIGRETHRIFGGYVSGVIIEAIIMGIMTYVGMLIFRLPFPLLVATVVGVTNIIPFFGPFIGGIPSAILILLVDPVKCFYFIIFIVVLQQIEGNIIAPRVLGDSIGISGFWVLVSITVAGSLFGFGGMLIGVPVFAVLYTLVKEWLADTLHKKRRPSETSAYIGMQEVADIPLLPEEDPDQIRFENKEETP